MADTVRSLAALLALFADGQGVNTISPQDMRDAIVTFASWAGVVTTLVPLDVAIVTTGGIAVTALSAGHCSAGGWIKNPDDGPADLGINQIGSATGTSSAGNTTFISPGEIYRLAASGNAVSVISSSSAHNFSGYGYQ